MLNEGNFIVSIVFRGESTFRAHIMNRIDRTWIIISRCLNCFDNFVCLSLDAVFFSFK